MNRSDVQKRLNSIFCDIFDDESIKISDSTSAADIEDWDSLEHINLIAAVEEEFGMKFRMKEVSGMKNVGEMLDMICERGSK